MLETGNFGFRKKRNCTIRVAKTKALISFAVTAKLICVFVFTYADCWFSHEAAHIALFHYMQVAQDRPQERPGPKVIKLFSCSDQLRLKFILLINDKMPNFNFYQQDKLQALVNDIT